MLDNSSLYKTLKDTFSKGLDLKGESFPFTQAVGIDQA